MTLNPEAAANGDVTRELSRAPRPQAKTRAWLLLAHQLPSHPSNLRVRTWRRLQQIGALAVKQAVYALPDSANAREDFEWLKTEIESLGGQASIFVADAVDTWTHDALVDEFRRAREAAYGELARDAEHILRRMNTGRRRTPRVPSRRGLQQLQQRLGAIEQIDFFGSAGRDRVAAVLRRIEERGTDTRRRASKTPTGDETTSYRGRLWVTRPRPGVDRMSSAWLIRRFIDPDASFAFAVDRDAVPAGAVAFDMFGGEFTHQGEACTFETLCSAFGIEAAPVARLSAIVHDLDLKDARFGAPEAATIGSLIDGLRLAYEDDDDLLAQGMALFESLYRAFEQSARSAGPRLLAQPGSPKRARRLARRSANGAKPREGGPPGKRSKRHRRSS
jgi:hypothetical protein